MFPISFNRYLYAESDPVNNIDPDGYSSKWLKKLSKGVKKNTTSVYNFLIGDDIATVRSKKTKPHQKALAGAFIALNFVPVVGIYAKGLKLGIKGTSKAVKGHKSSKKITNGSKKAKRSGKKIKGTKKGKTRSSSSIKRSPKTNDSAQVRVQKNTAKPKEKVSSAKKRQRGNTTTRIEKKQSKSSGTKGTRYVNNTKGLADDLGSKLGGTVSNAKGKGYKVEIPNGKKSITVRIMEAGSGGRNKPYYRVSIDGKGSLTLDGKISNNRNLTHIDITDDALKQIDIMIKTYKGK